MGRLGPAPKPTALRLLHGDRKDRINTDEPVPLIGTPECPPDVDPAVRKVWDYCIANLAAMGVVTMADRDALMCFCEAVVTHRKASALIARSPVLIQGHRGVLVRNPALAMQRDAAAIIRAFAHEFGFTPSARSEIHTGAAKSSATGADRYLTG